MLRALFQAIRADVQFRFHTFRFQAGQNQLARRQTTKARVTCYTYWFDHTDEQGFAVCRCGARAVDHTIRLVQS
jgi:protein tyrosine phosphatase (PTP) superfamily phosphohydrolase (DUF442 family)